MKDTGDSLNFYQNELDETWFQYDMTFGDLKNLTRRTASDKILQDKTFIILLKIRNMIDIEGVLLQWLTNFLIKNLQLKIRIFQTKN